MQILVFATLAAALVDWGKLPTYVCFNAITASFPQPSYIVVVSALGGSLYTTKIEVGDYLISLARFILPGGYCMSH